MGQFPYVEEILVIGTFHQQMVQAKKKKKKAFTLNTSFLIIPAVSQEAACLGHIRGSSVVIDRHKNSFDKEEKMHWLTSMLNYAADTKQALTRMMSEAPTKHILSVETIPTSHWKFLFDKHCLQTNGSDLEATGKTAQTKGEEKEKNHHEGENLALKRRWQRLSWEKVRGGRKREQ